MLRTVYDITYLFIHKILFCCLLFYILNLSMNSLQFYFSIRKQRPVITAPLLTYSMQQSPSWEANRFSASQEIPCILWNPKVHYHSHKCPSPVPILSQLNTVHILTSHFLSIHLNIILQSTPGPSKWSVSHIFLHQNPVYASPLTHSRYMPRPTHYSRFYHSNNIECGVQIIKLPIMWFSPLSCYLVHTKVTMST